MDCINEIERFEKFRQQCIKNFHQLENMLKEKRLNNSLENSIYIKDEFLETSISQTNELSITSEISNGDWRISPIVENEKLSMSDDIYTCKTNNDDWRTSSELENEKLSKSDDIYTCKNCDKIFLLERNYKTHLQKHKKCPECCKYFPSQNVLERHKREKHNGEKLFIKVCTICGKQCYSTTSFLYHMRSHNDENPYKCNICNKEFKIISHLNAHRQSHGGFKAHICRNCNKSFTTSYSLKIHMLIHTGERPFCCHVCNKTFTQNSTLKTHMKVHKLAS